MKKYFILSLALLLSPQMSFSMYRWEVTRAIATGLITDPNTVVTHESYTEQAEAHTALEEIIRKMEKQARKGITQLERQYPSDTGFTPLMYFASKSEEETVQRWLNIHPNPKQLINQETQLGKKAQDFTNDFMINWVFEGYLKDAAENVSEDEENQFSPQMAFSISPKKNVLIGPYFSHSEFNEAIACEKAERAAREEKMEAQRKIEMDIQYTRLAEMKRKRLERIKTQTND